MKVYLFKYAKRSNSTKRPTPSEGTAFDCELFEPFTVTAPTLLLRADNVFDYNYAFLPELNNRYYFVNDWTFENGLWKASTSEDYLASWKGTILESTQFIKRSTQGADTTLEDNFYTYSLSGITTTAHRPSATDFWKSPEQEGAERRVYVVINSLGIGRNPNTDTTLYPVESTIAMSKNVLKGLRSVLKNQDKARVNLYDYIVRAYVLPVYPFDDDIVTGLSNPYQGMIFYGDKDDQKSDCEKINAQDSPAEYLRTWGTFPQVTVTGPSLSPVFPEGNEIYLCPVKDTAIRTVTWTVENPAYVPEIEIYKRSRNYQKLLLKFQPFGTIEIDPNLHLTERNIVIKADVALGSGDATLYVSTGGQMLPIATTNVAVQIPLAQVLTNETAYRNQQIAGWTSLIANGLGVASGASAKQPKASGIIGRLGNMTNTLATMSVPMQTGSQMQGQPGTAIIDSVPELIAHRYLSTPTDVERFGGPTMRTITLRDLAGVKAGDTSYTVTKKGYCESVDAQLERNDMLSAEQTAVEELMNGGIYLE